MKCIETDALIEPLFYQPHDVVHCLIVRVKKGTKVKEEECFFKIACKRWFVILATFYV